MMRHVGVAIAGIVALSGCSTLLTPSGSAATRWAKLDKARAEAAKGPSGERKICKNMVMMGSNFPQKVCSTQAEWDTIDEQTRQSADEFDAGRRAGNTDSGFEKN